MFVVYKFEYGQKYYYTGRAGFGWVSANKAEAFIYTKTGAEYKADMFKSMFNNDFFVEEY